MAHSALHFAVGTGLGMLAFARPVYRNWRGGARLSEPLGRWVLGSLALGVFALAPGLLRHLGLPESFCAGWWMNVFVFHQLLNALKPGGLLVGEIALVACLSAQYVVVVAAVVSARRRRARS